MLYGAGFWPCAVFAQISPRLGSGTPVSRLQIGKNAEAWLPGQATLNALSSGAVLPSGPARPLADDDGVKLSDLFAWFDGAHSFEEETQPGYPPEMRPIPKVITPS